MINTEIWKSLDFLGFENHEVSNLGRVRSKNKLVKTRKEGIFSLRKGKILKNRIDKDGYSHVFLSNNYFEKQPLVHRLVCLAFLDNPNNYPCVNHKDEDKQNNSLDNLEWCTVEYNNNYGTHNERCKKSNITSEKRKMHIESIKKEIIKCDLEGNELEVIKGMKEAAENVNGKYQGISRCCRGLKHTAYGYKWKYKN